MKNIILNGLFKTWVENEEVPPLYREAYALEVERLNLQSARVLSFVAVALVPASVVLDYFIYPEHLMHFIVVRAVMSLSCLIVFLLTFIRRLQRHGSLLTMSAMFAAGAGIAYMVRVLGYGEPYYAGLNLVYLILMLTPWGLRRTLFTCWSIYSLYLFPILLWDMESLNLSLFVNNNVFQLETILIVVTINHFQSKRRRAEIINRLTIVHQAKELGEIDRFKREFIANITHELKTPLAIVLGNVDLIFDATDDPKLQKGLALIRRATFQLANHVDRIIAVSNADDPEMKLDSGNYDYNGIVQNTFSLFEPHAQQKNITFVLNLSSEPLVVNVDVVKVEEVLSNLIQNAFKFTPVHGIISVTVSTDDEWAHTEVSDSGVGIPEEKINKIFERMYQVDEVLSKRHGGIGLGLYICKKNIEMHKGDIFVHSSQGKGTSFRFSLPLHVDQSAKVYTSDDQVGDRVRRAAERRSGTDRRALERRRIFEYQQRMGLENLAQMTYTDNIRDYENQHPSQPTILILEDNAGMMKVIVEALRADYNLFLAFDAFEARRKLDGASDTVVLILSDIMMPGMNGFDFCSQVMAEERHRHIPLIFITALMSHADQMRGFAVGATDYIVKPYSIKILKEKVDHWVSRRQYEMLLKDAATLLEERVAQMTQARDIILHEIGNPLQMIEGARYFVEKLKNAHYDGAPASERGLWESVDALNHGIKAIRSVLETTKQFDMAEMSLRRAERVDMVIDDALTQTRHLTYGINLRVDVDKTASQIIHCDKRMLVQVLVNIIRNGAEAIRAKQDSTDGEIRVSSEKSLDQSIVVKVQDNGIGMPPKVVEKLFRFRYTNKANGHGIGLSLSKMVLKLHDGNIAVESKEGVGTTFALTLPSSMKERVCS